MQAFAVQLKTFVFNSFKSKKDIARVFLALLFIAASSLHFITDVELKIIPPFLPLRREAANLYHAFKNIQLGGILNSPVYHVIRLPLQAVLIWLVLWCTGKKRE